MNPQPDNQPAYEGPPDLRDALSTAPSLEAAGVVTIPQEKRIQRLEYALEAALRIIKRMERVPGREFGTRDYRIRAVDYEPMMFCILANQRELGYVPTEERPIETDESDPGDEQQEAGR